MILLKKENVFWLWLCSGDEVLTRRKAFFLAYNLYPGPKTVAHTTPIRPRCTSKDFSGKCEAQAHLFRYWCIYSYLQHTTYCSPHLNITLVAVWERCRTFILSEEAPNIHNCRISIQGSLLNIEYFTSMQQNQLGLSVCHTYHTLQALALKLFEICHRVRF